MKTSNFTTILWDVDGTLLDFAYSERYSIKKCFKSINRPITEEMITRYSEINLALWKKLELGQVTKQELLVQRFLSFFDEYNIRDVDVDAFRKEYQINLGSVYRYLDNSIDVIKKIKETSDIKQYTVTNGVSSIQRNKMKLAGFDEVMDDYFISEEVGIPKPAKEFFDTCFKNIDETDKSKILIVGDSLSSDIKGGVNAGIKTCWYRAEGTINDSEFVPDYEISRLEDVLNILFS